MAILGEIPAPVNGVTWAQQANASAVAAAHQSAQTAATRRVDKSRSDRRAEGGILGDLFHLASIQDGVEDGLESSIREAMGTLNGLLSDQQTMAALEDILGPMPADSSLTQVLRGLGQSFAGIADGRGDGGLPAAATAFAGTLKTITDKIQSLRGKADGDINTTVAAANRTLTQIADLNARVAIETVTGGARSGIDSQRDAALDALSGNLDIATFSRSDGTVAVFTKAGTPLVGMTAAKLWHRATTGITAAMSLADGSLSGITADGIEISGQITGGALHALLTARDSTLPNVQNQLDTLAQTLQAQINRVSNKAVATTGLSQSCRSSRRFQPWQGQRFSLSGGDVVASLSRAGDQPPIVEPLRQILMSYAQRQSIPDTGSWTAGLVAGALDQWLGRHLGGDGAPLSHVDEQGHLRVDLPGGGATLTFADRRSVTFASAVVGNRRKPLGLAGPLVFSDEAGNLMSTGRTAVAAGDSLEDIARLLDGVNGLAALVTDHPDGCRLEVSSRTGSDMTLLPDRDGASVVRGLRLLPLASDTAEDIVVNHLLGHAGIALTSAPQPSPLAPLGLSGPFLLCDGSGATILTLDLDPAWSLSHLASVISSAPAVFTITASVVAAGNRCVLKISPPMGHQIGLAGRAGAWQTSPQAGFLAAGGDLAIAIGHRPAGRLSVKAGADLNAIADAINAPQGPFVDLGIVAQAPAVEDRQYLEIAHRWGTPLRFEGSAVGRGAGRLDLALNVRDRLGLYPPCHQVISGFANFLGLSDVFLTGPEFDPKAPTGIFTSTAAPGIAGGLSFNPRFQDPSQPDRALASAMTDLLCGTLNIAAAGGLPRSAMSLPQYAEAIVAQVAARRRDTGVRVTFQKTYVGGLSRQKTVLAGMDMNETVSTLATFQQAFQDASLVASTLKHFFGSLGVQSVPA
jgi:hypothetical protein